MIKELMITILFFSSFALNAQKADRYFICKGWETGFQKIYLNKDKTFIYQTATDYGMSLSYRGFWSEKNDTLTLIVDRQKIKDESGYFSSGSDSIFFDNSGMLLPEEDIIYNEKSIANFYSLETNIVIDTLQFLVTKKKIFKILQNDSISTQAFVNKRIK